MYRQIDDGHKCYGLRFDLVCTLHRILFLEGNHYHLINMPFENLFHIGSMCRFVDHHHHDVEDDGSRNMICNWWYFQFHFFWT